MSTKAATNYYTFRTLDDFILAKLNQASSSQAHKKGSTEVGARVRACVRALLEKPLESFARPMR
jgi:hypothetical protein